MLPSSEVPTFRSYQVPGTSRSEVSGLGERIIDSFNYDNKSVVNMTKERFLVNIYFYGFSNSEVRNSTLPERGNSGTWVSLSFWYSTTVIGWTRGVHHHVCCDFRSHTTGNHNIRNNDGGNRGRHHPDTLNNGGLSGFDMLRMAANQRGKPDDQYCDY